MSDTPLWRQMFNTWEKSAAPGLQEMTASSGFQDLLALAAQANTSVAQEMEKASRAWLHMWNLPAGTDVRSLRRQVASLEREIGNLQRSLAEANRAARDTAPGSDAKADAPTAAKSKKKPSAGARAKSTDRLRTVS